jgi:hypothetical protein
VGHGEAGSTSDTYTYPPGSLGKLDGLATSSAGQVYPNTDLSYAEESACRTAGGTNRFVWPGEFARTQHLHYLFFQRDSGNGITLNGNGLENWWGILYNPGVAGCGTACQVKINGSGGGGLGPPLLTGQVIADNAKFSGSANFEIFYRACHIDADPCGYGPGSTLVQ